MNHLEQAFPATAEALPRRSFALLPTPVETLPVHRPNTQVWIKRDDLSGLEYGGNKVRKLEYLLGHAVENGLRKVVTFGTAGSNHALATGIYAGQEGLRSISMLTPQTNAAYVARNLLRGLRAGIEFHACRDDSAVKRALPWVRLRHRISDGKAPMVIAGGGSSVAGTIGFVNAGFELRAQIDAGQLPEPDFIYVALGTMGTAAGLLLGIRAAGLTSKLVCVRVVQSRYANPEKFAALLSASAAKLRYIAPAFPVLNEADLIAEFRDEFFGGGYARFTNEGMQAIRIASEAGSPELEGTYTGKAFAALVHDLSVGRLDGKRVLFWNTYNSRPFPSDLGDEDPGELPPELQTYFTLPVQALDAAG
ncbi:MAG: pyridoxal-phosphate dependent enzyme [Gammaproteobacteria bacterium]|nr:pyridoxal-phosphate dependent enzyme [Gammaproteobacteria bacterium]